MLGSIMAIGSLAGALLAARRKVPRLRVLLIALAGFTVASAIAALAPTYEVFALALIPTGLAALTALTTANAMVQTRGRRPDARPRHGALHGRLHGRYARSARPIIGWIGDAFGARWTIGIGAVAVGLSLVAVAALALRRHNVRVRYESHRRPGFTVTTAPVSTSPGGPEPSGERPVPAAADHRRAGAARRARGRRGAPCAAEASAELVDDVLHAADQRPTSSGSTAGNSATRSWLRPSLR